MAGEGWTIRFEGYQPVDERIADRLARVCRDIAKLPAAALHVDEVSRVITVDCAQVKEWLAEARDSIRVSRVGERLVIKPAWDEYEPADGDMVIEIDPGAAFGSGLHESTQLCLRALEQCVKRGMCVADFGTGTGILAIAAAKLGAARVTALELDTEAVQTARDNVQRNGLGNVVVVYESQSLDVIGDPVDLLSANITADIIASYARSLAGVVKRGGLLISSGMTWKNCGEVEQSLVVAGFEMVERLTEGEWVAFVATRR